MGLKSVVRGWLAALAEWSSRILFSNGLSEKRPGPMLIMGPAVPLQETEPRDDIGKIENGIPHMIPLMPDESASLDALATSLGVSSKDLFVLINFESGWSPSARNAITGARGLIQFMPDTARSLGYRDADDLVDRFPTRKAQLDGPVRAYLQRLKPFNGTAQDLFMSVFYPAARKWSLYAPFSKAIQDSNPGIKTPYDYVNKAYAVAGLRYVAPVAVLLVLAGIAWFLLKK